MTLWLVLHDVVREKASLVCLPYATNPSIYLVPTLLSPLNLSSSAWDTFPAIKAGRFHCVLRKPLNVPPRARRGQGAGPEAVAATATAAARTEVVPSRHAALRCCCCCCYRWRWRGGVPALFASPRAAPPGFVEVGGIRFRLSQSTRLYEVKARGSRSRSTHTFS